MLFVVSILFAGAASFWISPPHKILSPEASQAATVLMAIMAFALYFAVLFPLWLPATIPARMSKLYLVVSSACGLLLLAVALALLYLTSGSPSLPTGLFIALAGIVGSLHLASARWRAAKTPRQSRR